MSRRPLAVALVASAAVLALGGCATTKKTVAELPANVDATVQVAQDQNKIEFIDIQPWSVKPGGYVDATVRGAKGRNVTLNLTGQDGKAAGVNKSVTLDAKEPGVYTGRLSIDDNLPPGRYRVEAVMTGGTSAEPTKLVSSRMLTIEAPPPPPVVVDACEEVKTALKDPKVFFAYDKEDITDASAAAIKDAAARLSSVKDRVARVTIEGHCDERGTVEYNLALGSRRANAVKQALAAAGFTGNVETVSKGKEEPAVANAGTEEEHARNRRAFYVVQCTPAR